MKIIKCFTGQKHCMLIVSMYNQLLYVLKIIKIDKGVCVHACNFVLFVLFSVSFVSCLKTEKGNFPFVFVELINFISK